MEQLTTLLQQLANQLGVSVDYLWPYLVRWTFAQHLSAFFVNIVLAVIAAILAYICSKILRAGWGKPMGDEAPSAAFFQVAGGIIGIIALSLFATASLSEASRHIAGILVPEAQAIIDIIAKVNVGK